MQTTYVKRKYTVWGVSRESADRLQFDVDDETSGRRTKTTVAAYFKDRYKMQLRYASLHLTSPLSSRDFKKQYSKLLLAYEIELKNLANLTQVSVYWPYHAHVHILKDNLIIGN